MMSEDDRPPHGFDLPPRRRTPAANTGTVVAPLLIMACFIAATIAGPWLAAALVMAAAFNPEPFGRYTRRLPADPDRTEITS